MSVIQLWLPILISGAVLFFASFLSWVVVLLHFQDWRKCPAEIPLLEILRNQSVPAGSYMLPGAATPAEMNSPEFQQQSAAGPRGVLTVFGPFNMGRNLALTFLFYLGISFCLGYLATLGLQPGDSFAKVFRFMATAGIISFPAGMIQHAIWFEARIVGHLLESVVYALLLGLVFAGLWPAA